jgi:hypothetical protein
VCFCIAKKGRPIGFSVSHDKSSTSKLNSIDQFDDIINQLNNKPENEKASYLLWLTKASYDQPYEPSIDGSRALLLCAQEFNSSNKQCVLIGMTHLIPSAQSENMQQKAWTLPTKKWCC